MAFTLSSLINLNSSFVLCILIFATGFTDRYLNYFKPKMSGHSSFAMKSVVQHYRKFIEKNQDLGSSFAVYNGSLKVIDLIGGYEDLEFQQIWNRNTISQLFSISNIVGILSMAHLLDRGHLDYDNKISKYLPYCHHSFANTTISDILNHKGNIPFFTKPISITDYRDEPDLIFQHLLSKPPTTLNNQIFHKYTLGIIIDALIRQIDPKKRTLADYFNQEIGNKNQIDILVGLPRTQIYRAARLYNPSLRQFVYAMGRFDIKLLFSYFTGHSEIVQKIESTFSDIDGTKTKSPEYLEIPLASWNVFSNADSIAKLFSIAFFGTTETPPILKRSTVKLLCEKQNTYYDNVLQTYVTFTKGGLMSFDGPVNSGIYGWRDPTGQFILLNLDTNITIAYITNHLRALSSDKDYIYSSLLNAIYDVIL